MDLMTGGDLRYHINYRRKFSEEETKFFVQCLVCTLDYIHAEGIIHRVIKPENLVLDEFGYLHLTDFGIARKLKGESRDNKNETSGTPGYMAPEVMFRKNHDYGVDYFAVGVIAYEFMMGRRPYVGKSRRDIRDAMISKQAYVSRRDLPRDWSLHAANFVNRLLSRKPSMRLGFQGVEEVKQHPWLKDTNWAALYAKQIEAPFRPPLAENFASEKILNNDPWLAANQEAVA
jgi:serum/glucocorticoid-regulated kinase 2